MDLRKWRQRSAIAGGAAWLAAAAVGFGARLDLIEMLFLLAPLVIVPLGLELVAPHAGGLLVFRAATLLQPFAAVTAALSFWLDPGLPAALAACAWLLVATLAALPAIFSVPRTLVEACERAALLYLPAGGGWLVLSRLGAAPLGFEEPIVLLTAVHFHYAGFAAPLLAAAVGRALAVGWPRFLFRFAAGVAVAGPALLAAGFVVSPRFKVIAALLLAAGLAALSAVTFAGLGHVRRGVARAFAAVSAALLPGMALAGVYAAGEFAGRPWPDIPQMAALHGVANSIGFALCGLIAWNLAAKEIV